MHREYVLSIKRKWKKKRRNKYTDDGQQMVTNKNNFIYYD